MQGKPNDKEVVISLRIMRKYLHEIVKGTKKIEYRQLNKYNVELFMFTDKKGMPVEFRNIIALKLYVGNETNCEFAVVNVDDYGTCEHGEGNEQGSEVGDFEFYFKLGNVTETNVSL